MREPCLCGDDCCPRCYPGSYQANRRAEAHAEHDQPDLDQAECPECIADAEAPYIAAEMRYDQLKEEGRLR